MADQPRGLLVNLATVEPEHEEAFNHWYHTEHINDVRKRFPQIVNVRRYRANDGEEPRYLVLYEFAVDTEAEFEQLMRPDNPLRHELWKIYDEAVGHYAKRSRRSFWQVWPDDMLNRDPLP